MLLPSAKGENPGDLIQWINRVLFFSAFLVQERKIIGFDWMRLFQGLLLMDMVPAGTGIKTVMLRADPHQVVCALSYIQ